MLRLTRHHRSWVSNKLAVFAALLLLITAAAGIRQSFPNSSSAQKMAAEVAASEVAAENALRSETAGNAEQDKGFKMSLYLFRFSR